MVAAKDWQVYGDLGVRLLYLAFPVREFYTHEEQNMKIADVNVTIKDLASDIYGSCSGYSKDDCEYIDLRLQVFDGQWFLRTGDAQYDTDHRGVWGNTSISVPITKAAAYEAAKTLIESCSDYWHQ
jgi:hypothetical protein